MSLDAFQSKYTSEDNASFSEILEKSIIDNQAKHSWIFDADKKTLVLEDKPGMLLIEGKEMQDTIDQKGNIQLWNYKVFDVLTCLLTFKGQKLINVLP